LPCCKGNTFISFMYRMVKIFWSGEVVYPRTISPEPFKICFLQKKILTKYYMVHIL